MIFSTFDAREHARERAREQGTELFHRNAEITGFSTVEKTV